MKRFGLVLVFFLSLSVRAFAAPCDPVNLQANGLTFILAYNACIASLASGALGISGVTAFGTQSSGSQLCPNTSGACTVTLTGSGVTLSASTPTTPSGTQVMIWQLTQDGTGGWAPTWDGSAFHFASGLNPVPILTPGAVEQFAFVWNPALSLWDYQARGGTQHMPSTNQGANNGLGFGIGDSGTATLGLCPANVWTQVVSDNGGFFVGQGGGVNEFDYMQVGEITLCNYNFSTEFFSTYCYNTGFNSRVSSDREIDGNQCIDVPFVSIEQAIPALLEFASFDCFVDGTNQLTVLFHSIWTLEEPNS